MVAVVPLILKADPDALDRLVSKVEGSLDAAGKAGGKMAGEQVAAGIASKLGGAGGALASAIGGAVGSIGGAIGSSPLYQSAGDAAGSAIGPGGRTFVNTAAQNILNNGALSAVTLGGSNVLAGMLQKSEAEAQAREGRTAFDQAKGDVSAIGGQLAAAGVEFTDEELGQAVGVRQGQRQRMLDFQLRMKGIEYSEGAQIDARSFSGIAGR